MIMLCRLLTQWPGPAPGYTCQSHHNTVSVTATLTVTVQSPKNHHVVQAADSVAKPGPGPHLPVPS